MVWIPSVFNVGAGFLAESGEGDLREAVFDDFVAVLEFVFFPVTEFACGAFDSLGDFCDLFVGERVVINLFPIFFIDTVAIVLGALSDEEVEM